MVNQAVILAGGRGVRLKPLTDTIPKPMVEVGGRPFLYYITSILRDIGISDIVVLVGHLKEKFSLPGVRYCKAEDTVNSGILGIPGLEDSFIVVNGDCLPLLKWRPFIDTKSPRVAVKTVNGHLRDTGICIVSRQQVETGLVDCGNIGGLVSGPELGLFIASGNLHIGTPEGLKKAEEWVKTFWKEKNEQ